MAYTDIDDPSAYFTTTLYTGNATARSITNSANAGDFQPDWLWIKVRNNANNHRLFDSSRGANLDLVSNLNQADSDSADRCTDFDSNGFSLGVNGEVNSNTHNIVAWQWKANGGTTASNTDGSITTTVQANTTAGFSIVTWTGNATNGATIGHGLGGTPEWVYIKNRATAVNWAMGHKSFMGANAENIRSDGAAALGDAGDAAGSHFSRTAPSSTVITLGSGGDGNYSTDTNRAEAHIAYCFRSIQGYSKIGKYTGNGNANGTFVYTGFKPAYVMVKRTNGTGSWVIHDSARAGFSNPTDEYVYGQATNVEATDIPHDFLSNGFKMRATLDDSNGSGSTYIYMAFADSPFVSSKGVPTTAR